MDNSSLVVVHVVQGSTGVGTIVSPHVSGSFVEEESRLLADYEHILKDRDKENVRMLVQVGEPAEKILETVRDAKSDLVVLGRRGTGCFEKLLVGRVSQKVINDADCSVLISK